MNSSQLNFFMTPADWPHVLDFLDQKNLKIAEEIVKDPQQFKLVDINKSLVLSPRKILLASPEFNNIFIKYSERIGSYRVETDESYIVEFSPGGFFPNQPRLLQRARFYCVNGYYVSNGEKVEKSIIFRNWVKKLFKDFKKEFLEKLGDEKVVYFSKRTMKLLGENKGKVDSSLLTIRLSD